uniref:Retrotransposon hot spot (RHS) protein n=1 Tax=Panagrellus redivivus TaxID=6233 RepID=A0A7E4VXJ3_PANRE
MHAVRAQVVISRLDRHLVGRRRRGVRPPHIPGTPGADRSSSGGGKKCFEHKTETKPRAINKLFFVVRFRCSFTAPAPRASPVSLGLAAALRCQRIESQATLDVFVSRHKGAKQNKTMLTRCFEDKILTGEDNVTWIQGLGGYMLVGWKGESLRFMELDALFVGSIFRGPEERGIGAINGGFGVGSDKLNSNM